MKRCNTCFRIVLLALMVAQVSSCKKVAEEILKDPCADIKFCNIKSYTYPGFSGFDDNTAIFTYDSYGNPLTVTNTRVSTGAPNLIFRYDAAHRLTEFFRPYANGQFETWTKYVYDASGRITSDTSFVFGTNAPSWPPAEYRQRRLTTYTYDGTCRVTQTSTIGIGGPEDGFPPFIQSYAYDVNGNLIRPGVTYDNKVNIHRTNKIFMFVDRDYSMNNPYTATTYNGYGLPSVVGAPLPGPSVYFLLRLIDHASFSYQCD